MNLRKCWLLACIACAGAACEAAGNGNTETGNGNTESIFAWQIVQEIHEQCLQDNCSRRSVVEGGEFAAADAEDWVATLAPEAHARLQDLATDPAFMAFARAPFDPVACPIPLHFHATLEVRLLKTAPDGAQSFETLMTDATSCLIRPEHPAGALFAEIQRLRQMHRPTLMPGRGRICVATDGAWPSLNHHDYSFFGEVEGVVESFDQAPAALEGQVAQFGQCELARDAVVRTLVLRAGTQRWHVRFSASTGAPQPMPVFPELAPWAGKAVRMTMHRGATQSDPEGIVITEAGQLLFAMQATEYSIIIKPDYTPGLTVSRGAPVLTERAVCAPRTHNALSFAGDNSVLLAAGQTGSFTIKGLPYSARTVTSHTRMHPRCEGAPNPAIWIVWRP